MKPIYDEPAFPHTAEQGPNGIQGGYGMTLRDYFAAKAMQAALTGCATRAEMVFWSDIAGAAYEVADAMLKARSA